MRKSHFKKHIEALSEQELREELDLLYSRLEEVRKFYTMELGSSKDRQKKYEAAKKAIAAKFATKGIRKPRRPRIQKVKQILNATGKMSVLSYEMIDIYLFTVETALNFMAKYNFYSVPIFNTVVQSFENALTLIEENKMDMEYEERCRQILGNSRISRDIHHLVNESYQRIYG
mgnify:CR=1 FL=1